MLFVRNKTITKYNFIHSNKLFKGIFLTQTPIQGMIKNVLIECLSKYKVQPDLDLT